MIENELIFHRASIFEEIGLARIEARVLSALLEGKTMNSRDIEKQMDIRQPEVSIGATKLQARGWIREQEVKSTGKGRPQKIFEMAVKFPAIVKELRIELEKENKNRKDKIIELEETCKKQK